MATPIESGQRRIDVVEFLQLAKAIGFDPAVALQQLLAVKEASATKAKRAGPKKPKGRGR